MKQNNLYRYEEADDRTIIPIAAGAEMVNLFANGFKRSCATESCNRLSGEQVILCHLAEASLPPIGQNIRRLRLAQNMTQRELALHLRVSMQAVSKWERQAAYPDLTLLVPIARLFKITLDELFGCE